MAKTFKLTSSKYDGRYMELVCTQTPNDSKSNSSTIEWTLTTAGGDSLYYSTGPTKVIINGQTVYSKSRVAWDSYGFPAKKGSVSGTLTVNHANDGEKSIAVSFSTAIAVATVSTYSDTWELDAIPRYATVTQSVKSKDEESITINWVSDSIIDYLWYSVDDGDSWSGLSVNDKTSGSYTISGCQSGTWHFVKTRVRRKDSQLKTDSDMLRVITYEYPCCTSTPDFVIGEKVKLEFYNPLKREITFKVIANGVTLTHDWVTSGESYTGLSAESTQAQLYASIPNEQRCQYAVAVTYNGHTITTDEGNSYEINPAVCKPSFSGFTYRDYIGANVTGNDQILIKSQSGLRVTIPSANKMVTVNGATPKYYVASIDGKSVKSNFSNNDVIIDLGTVESAGVKRLTVRAYDSRGIPSDAIYQDVTVCDWGFPVINVDINRVNNFEAQTPLKISGTYSPIIINGVEKNRIAEVFYYYRETDGEWSKQYPVNYTASNGEYTCSDVVLTLDRSKSYEVTVVVYDLLDSNEVDSTVGVGQAVFMISSNKKACYINGVQVPTFESVYPIGSVYCSSTNNNPSEIYGGEWELIDKGFKTGTLDIEQGVTEYLSTFDVSSVRTGQIVRFRLHLTTAKEIADSSVTLGTVDLGAHGLLETNESYFLYGIFGGVAISDGGNATITYDFNNTGVLEINDCLNVDGTHVLPAGSSFYINAVVSTSQSRMSDEFCDKFYWKRIA